MTDLSTRAESAAPEETRGLLKELACRIWARDYIPEGVDPDFWVKRWNRFKAALRIGASPIALVFVPFWRTVVSPYVVYNAYLENPDAK